MSLAILPTPLRPSRLSAPRGNLAKGTRIAARPRIGIMVLNENGRHWLPSIFQSLAAQGYPNKRVYLVDNASKDGSAEMTLAAHPDVTVLRMDRNLGYCMAYNLAMPHAFADGCEWVIWANNDIRLEPGCLEELAMAAQQDPDIGVLGPAFFAWENDQPNGYMQGNHPQAIPAMQARAREVFDVQWIEGSCLMVSRPCVENVGPLDPYLFFYWEDCDFCRRARRQGWRVLLVPAARARHYAGGWSAGDPHNAHRANHLQTRNAYIYALADPHRPFLANQWTAWHIFLIYLKQSLLHKPLNLAFHVRAFLRVLAEIPAIRKKWRRDRQGGHPPLTTEPFSSSKMEIIPCRHSRRTGDSPFPKNGSGGHP